MRITAQQWLGIVTIVLGVLVTSSSQLTDMGVPPGWVKGITAASGLLLAIVGGLNTLFNTQANQVRTVTAMPGVEKIQTNNQASAALISVAADPTQPKVEPPKGG